MMKIMQQVIHLATQSRKMGQMSLNCLLDILTRITTGIRWVMKKEGMREVNGA